jgi:DnaA family protein
MIQQQHRLLFSATMAPQYLALALRDLQSRLTAATIFHLQRLDETEQIALLVLRAKYRGIELTPAVATYILQHWSRGFSQLLIALEKLDEASLIEQRKLTLPFVKKVMGW